MTTMFPVMVTHPYFDSPGYGLGLMGDVQSRYGRVFGHTGQGPGYSASAYYFDNLANPVSIAALSNSDDAQHGDAIVFALAESISSVAT